MRRHRLSTVAAVLSIVAVSCAKPPAPAPAPVTIAAPPTVKTKTTMTVSASAETNPDATGRPSPVVVRVYQLKTDAAFTAASFIDLFEREDTTLGTELISRDEYVLAPKESRTIDIVIADETRFVGAVAAFRDILNAQWRVLAPAPRKGLSVVAERQRLLMSPIN